MSRSESVESLPEDVAPRHGTRTQTVVVAVGMVVFFSAFYLFGLVVGQDQFLRRVAIDPRRWQSIYSVVTYATGHVDPMHLVTNMVQMVPLAACATLTRGWRNCLRVTVAALVGSGLFIWLVAPDNALVIGASGITAGLASYLFVRSGIDKDLYVLAVSSVFVALVIIGVMSTLSSHDTVVSWHAHVGGLLSGIILACTQLIIERRGIVQP